MTLVQVISDGGARGRHVGVGVSWLTKDWTGADWSVGVGVSLRPADKVRARSRHKQMLIIFNSTWFKFWEIWDLHGDFRQAAAR